MIAIVIVSGLLPVLLCLQAPLRFGDQAHQIWIKQANAVQEFPYLKLGQPKKSS